MDLPSRVHDADAVRRRHGDRADRLLGRLWDSDPLADDVVATLAERPELRDAFDRALTEGRREPDFPDAFVRFFDHLDRVPAWVDWARVDRAGALFFRTGLPGGIVLGAKSLCYGYISPGGNKPLVMTGQLTGDHLGMRLARTSRFVAETCREGGLRRLAPGFIVTVRVRLMHAGVRRMLQQRGDWNAAAWAVPINQHDMLGTALLFSLSFIDGVRQFGFHVTDEEAEDYMHLWRYASYVMGVDEDLYPRDIDDARVLADIIETTQGPPDRDARKLVYALICAPERVASTPEERRRAEAQVAAGYGFVRSLLGDDIADQLTLPKNLWRFAIPAVSRVIRAVEPIRRVAPALDRAYRRAGDRYWEGAIAAGGLV